VRVSSRENNVVINSGVDDLSNNVAVGLSIRKGGLVIVSYREMAWQVKKKKSWPDRESS
jgi:hypothetical protein